MKTRNFNNNCVSFFIVYFNKYYTRIDITTVYWAVIKTMKVIKHNKYHLKICYLFNTKRKYCKNNYYYV